jgi:oligoendopeptidase F
MTTAHDYFHQLNQDYLNIHRQKEDLFWSTYMATSDQSTEFDNAQKAWSEFISNPKRITEIKTHLKTLQNEPLDNEALIKGLKGWLALFEANSFESVEARSQKNKLIDMESHLFKAKQNYKLHYTNEQGDTIETGLPTLGAIVKANENEAVRRSAHQAFLDLEQWVLNNGFIELVKARNAFARSLGFKTFFDYSVRKTEQMTTEELFTILDDFNERTKAANTRCIQQLIKDKGEAAAEGHNFRFYASGSALRKLDPYLPFSKSLQRWQETFGRLRINYSNAELTLDLLERDKKYQNGFCHGPVPSFYNQGKWVSAKVNFTANAQPDQAGAGYIGLATLFHEGGHAAHFANVKQNAPCFSQEFAPTSMAYAETQSMFLDRLLEDADWLKLYAKDNAGNTIPDEVIREQIESRQPFHAQEERSILVVPYFERALYAMADNDLTPESITKLARDTEQRILGLAVSPRPMLAIPHLLSDEASCAYHGYLLADMAVYQTRAYFLKTDGYITDNQNIGPALAKHYWSPGNSLSHDETIQSLTGEGFNAKYLADACNASIEQAWQQAQKQISAALARTQPEVHDLNAQIRVVDGLEILANNDVSMTEMNQNFEAAIERRYV